MAASYDECVAQFPRQQVCLDRVYSRLLAWAAYITATALPPTDTAPDKGFVQQRILAERMPAQATFYTSQVSGYLLEVPNVTNSIREHLNAWNDEATETTLSSDIDTSLATVMPKFADAVISDGEVKAWCEKHGYPVPEGLAAMGFM